LIALCRAKGSLGAAKPEDNLRFAKSNTQLFGCFSLDGRLYATRRLHMPHSIEKTIQLAAPIARVWRALTNYEEFGAWFRVKLTAPFAAGITATGHIAYPGYERC
jgi:hypothetical protein